MKNDHIGVLIPKSSQFDPNVPELTPAPIRSIIYVDETNGNAKTNYLHAPTSPLTMSTEILYETPDSAAIQINYAFNKPELEKNGVVYETPGPGYYRVTVRLLAAEKAAMILEESDFEVSWEMPVSDGLMPDRGRYLGHHSTSLENAMTPRGMSMKNSTERAGMPLWI